jgi:hypothetical protein
MGEFYRSQSIVIHANDNPLAELAHLCIGQVSPQIVEQHIPIGSVN